MTLYEFLLAMRNNAHSFRVCDETGKELLADSIDYNDMVDALKYDETDAEQILNALSEKLIKTVDFVSDTIYMERGF